MNLDEDAAISYEPDDNDDDGVQAALAEAERLISHSKGIYDIGKTKTPTGEDAIVVYVENQQVLSQLPAVVRGFSVIGEFTGEIRAF
jgi:dihydropteroate synthase